MNGEGGWQMSLFQDLQQIIKDPTRLKNDLPIRELHSKDQTSYHTPTLPDVVVYPNSTEEVSQIVSYARKHKIPITPYGIGTSTEGQVIPMFGGISLDFHWMNQILEIRRDDFLAVVEPGVTRNQLNQTLKEYNLFFPIDPGIDASLGGMAATNASGSAAVRYGAMKDNILGLEVVQSDGSIIHTGGMTKKSSSGYNLTQLFVGSEGTLGIITKLIVRLYALPKFVLFAKITFPNMKAACHTVQQIMTQSILLDRIEFVDSPTIEAVNNYKQTDFTPAPTLFLELSGESKTVNHNLAVIQKLSQQNGCLEIDYDTDPVQRENLWTARREAAFAIKSRHPEKKLMTTDVCVPLSVLPKAVEQTRNIMTKYQKDGAIFGHVGDGNFHAVFLIDPNHSEDLETSQKINEEIVHFALKNGGTCSGEHGIGIGKIKYLLQEHDQAIQLMKNIKQTFDPMNILNPGKLLP